VTAAAFNGRSVRASMAREHPLHHLQHWRDQLRPGLEILRQASKGLPRQAGRILCTAMRLAVPKGLNHLPDELLQQAIAELQ